VAPEIAYVKFWRIFREQAGRQASPEQVTIRLNHKPAGKTQVDFCDGVFITERDSGKKTLTSFSWASCRLVRIASESLSSIRSLPLSSGSIMCDTRSDHAMCEYF
jgi:hypothetical protein